MVKELLVRTGNPAALDNIVQVSKAVVGQDANGHYALEYGKDNNSYFVVRCFGDIGFTRFLIEQRKLGEIVGERNTD